MSDFFRNEDGSAAACCKDDLKRGGYLQVSVRRPCGRSEPARIQSCSTLTFRPPLDFDARSAEQRRW